MGSQPRLPPLIQPGLDTKSPQSKILRQRPHQAHLHPAIRAKLPFKVLRIGSLVVGPTNKRGRKRAQPGPPAAGAGSAPRLLVAGAGHGGTRSEKLGLVRRRAARGRERGRGLGQ